MSTAGTNWERVHKAILQAFDRQDLKELVAFRLDRTLDEIASGNLSTTVFDLLGRARREGWLKPLLEAMLEKRPNDENLQAAITSIITATPAAPPAPPPTPIEPLAPTPRDPTPDIGRGTDIKLTADASPPEYQYSNVFRIGSITIPYISLIGSWEDSINEYMKGDITSIVDQATIYRLPLEFEDNSVKDFVALDQPKCRLLGYRTQIAPGSNIIEFTFSQVRYSDYIKSGEFLDDPVPGNPSLSFRDKFARAVVTNDIGRSELTNICGVGIFVKTLDDKLLISKHSPSVHVQRDVWSYSASGTMDWSEKVHPFDEVVRECWEEIRYRVHEEELKLFGFGIDTEHLYFQFGFLVESFINSGQILSQAIHAKDYHVEMAALEALDFDLYKIVEAVRERRWEPAAAAGLLTLCAKRYGLEEVERAIDPGRYRRHKREEMLQEWKRRAQRPGNLAVMSVRYPSFAREEESRRYVEHAMSFIGRDVLDQDVLEIGSGIGRFTRELVRLAKMVTCLDLSEEMTDRNKASLGEHSKTVSFYSCFAQDYDQSKKHDMIICSLVLIHNVDQLEFGKLVDVMTACAPVIFLFEHIDVGQQVSEATRPRSEEELLRAFSGYRVAKRELHRIFTDHIVFVKLERRG